MTPYMPKSMSMPPQGLMSIPEVAGAAEKVVKDVMKVEPMIAGMAGMFVPGLSMVQPWILMLVPFLERALDDISASNNGDIVAAFLELIQHLSAGKPDSQALAPEASTLGNSLGLSSIGPSADSSTKAGG